MLDREPGSHDGEGAGDHNEDYIFGRPTIGSKEGKLTEKEKLSLLKIRSQVLEERMDREQQQSGRR